MSFINQSARKSNKPMSKSTLVSASGESKSKLPASKTMPSSRRGTKSGSLMASRSRTGASQTVEVVGMKYQMPVTPASGSKLSLSRPSSRRGSNVTKLTPSRSLSRSRSARSSVSRTRNARSSAFKTYVPSPSKSTTRLGGKTTQWNPVTMSWDPVTASGAYDIESQTPATPQVAVMAPPEPKKKNYCCWATLAILGLLLLIWVVLECTGNGFFSSTKPEPKKWHCTKCQAIVPKGVSLCDKCTHKPPPKKSWTCSKCKRSIPGTNPQGAALCDDCKPKEIKWSEFSSTFYVDNYDPTSMLNKITHTFSNRNKTVKFGGETDYDINTVRGNAWVPRDGRATGTINVQYNNIGGSGHLALGVLTERYGGNKANMTVSKHAYYYTPGLGEIYHPFMEMQEGPLSSQNAPLGKTTVGGFPYLFASLFKVTLRKGTVTFYKDDVKMHSFVLPKDCGRISLGASGRSAKITIL